MSAKMEIVEASYLASLYIDVYKNGNYGSQLYITALYKDFLYI